MEYCAQDWCGEWLYGTYPCVLVSDDSESQVQCLVELGKLRALCLQLQPGRMPLLTGWIICRSGGIAGHPLHTWIVWFLRGLMKASAAAVQSGVCLSGMSACT